MEKKTGLILALDVLSLERALELVNLLQDRFDAIKIGYPLILGAGLDVVHLVSAMAPVIVDLKLADIPHTNELISRQVLAAGAKGIIAHTFTGRDSLQAAVKTASQFGADVFAVTEMSHPGALDFMAPLADKLARMAVEAGASGVVAPATRPDRIGLIRSIVGDRIIISPGVGAQGGSPAQALQAGADFLIVGRSVIEAKDPLDAADKILREISR